jgi:hypothetical protein
LVDLQSIIIGRNGANSDGIKGEYYKPSLSNCLIWAGLTPKNKICDYTDYSLPRLSKELLEYAMYDVVCMKNLKDAINEGFTITSLPRVIGNEIVSYRIGSKLSDEIELEYGDIIENGKITVNCPMAILGHGAAQLVRVAKKNLVDAGSGASGTECVYQCILTSLLLCQGLSPSIYNDNPKDDLEKW